MAKNRELSIAEEQLDANVKQSISALESILKTAKNEYENYIHTGEGESMIHAANHLSRDIIWFVANRSPDLLTYAQRVNDEYEQRAKKI